MGCMVDRAMAMGDTVTVVIYGRPLIPVLLLSVAASPTIFTANDYFSQ